ncbi:hypothetical protein THAOC_18174, partial [Thalassiosira oceanica]
MVEDAGGGKEVACVSSKDGATARKAELAALSRGGGGVASRWKPPKSSSSPGSSSSTFAPFDVAARLKAEKLEQQRKAKEA